jgi:hypothetical protein
MNFFVKLWKSTASFRFYREIAHQKVSRSIGYFFLFILLISVVLSLSASTFLIQHLARLAEDMGDKLPEVQIVDGVVSTSVTEPYFYGDENFIFIIDTTGGTTAVDVSYQQGILLAKNKVILKLSTIETREYDLSKIKSFTLDKEALKSWQKSSSRLALPVLLVGFFFYLLVIKGIQILFFSVIALIINNNIQANLKYENLFNISLFALTPPVLFTTVFTVFGFRFPFFGFFYVIIYLIFLVGGIKSCKAN